MLTRARKKAKTEATAESNRHTCELVNEVSERLPSVLLSIVYGYAKPKMTRSRRQMEKVRLCCATEDGKFIYTVMDQPPGYLVQCVETTHFESISEYISYDYGMEGDVFAAAILGKHLYVVYYLDVENQGITRLSLDCRRPKNFYINSRATNVEVDGDECGTQAVDDDKTRETKEVKNDRTRETDRKEREHEGQDDNNECVTEELDEKEMDYEETCERDDVYLFDILPYKRKNVLIASRPRGQLQHITFTSKSNCVKELKSSYFSGRFFAQALALNEVADEVYMVTLNAHPENAGSEVVRVVDADTLVQKQIISCGTGFNYVTGITWSRYTDSIYAMLYYYGTSDKSDSKCSKGETHCQIIKIGVHTISSPHIVPLEFPLRRCGKLLVVDHPTVPCLLTFDSTSLRFVRVPL